MKTKNRTDRRLLAGLIPLLLAGGTAIAMPPSGPLTFDDFDLNGDGVITRQEMDQVRSQRMAVAGKGRQATPAQPGRGTGMGGGRGGHRMPAFQEFDLNGDGVLIEEEFIEARGQRVAQRAKEGRQMKGLANMLQFSDLDRNGDGQVTPAEFQGGMMRHRQSHMQQGGRGGRGGMNRPGFGGIDQDGDGYVSQQEFEAARARHMARWNQRPGARPMPPQPPRFPNIDSDGDGRISPQEMEAFRASRMRRFAPYPR